MTAPLSTRPLRVLWFGINFAPEPMGIAVITTWLVEQFAARGWRSDVVTGLPHIPWWRARPQLVTRAARPYRLRRRRHYVPRRQSALRRGLYELSWLLTASPEALRSRDVDLVIGVTPSLGGAVLAYLASKRLGVPYALIVQDVLGEAALQTGVDGARWVARGVGAIEAWLARRAAGVAVIAESFREHFARRGTNPDRLHLLKNPARLPPPSADRADTRAALGWRDTDFVVLHSGNMGFKQGLESAIRAAALARSSAPSVRFVLQGDGNQRARLEALATDAALENLEFLPPASQEAFPAILRAADALLVNQRASVRNMCLPSKLQTYLMAGRPVIGAVAADDEAAREIEASEAGLVIAPEDPAALVAAASRLHRDAELCRRLAANGPTYATETRGEDVCLSAYESFFRGCVGNGAFPA